MTRACRPGFIVQGVDDGLFLATGRDGDVRYATLVAEADAFDDPASAFDAANDHFDSRAIVHQVWIPED
jgi:hypothetical protein